MTTMTSPRVAVDARSLHKRFGTVDAVRGVTFQASHGHVTALLGPNGAGKTTTIALATGLLEPDAGSVSVMGVSPAHASAQQRAQVGVMVQDGGLANGVRVETLLRYAASMYTNPLPVDELMARLDLEGVRRTIVRRLSGGERQRLALAMAIVGQPSVVFLDEPTAGMDPAIRRSVRTLIRELANDGTAVLLTSHLMDDVVGIADDIVVITDGSVRARGSVAEVIETLRHGASAAVRASFSPIAPEVHEAFTQELHALAARFGAHSTVETADAAALEDVLIALETGEAR